MAKSPKRAAEAVKSAGSGAAKSAGNRAKSDGNRAKSGLGSAENPFGEVNWKRSGLRNKDNRVPSGLWKWLAPLLFLAGIILAFLWGFFHIQNDIEDAAPRILEQQGIDPSGLTFDASFRDVEVGGTLPDGVTAAQIEDALENNNLDDEDFFDDDDDEGLESEDIRDATITAAAAAAPALGPIAVTALSDGDTITLNGQVPSEEHRDELVEAAEGTGLQVVDEITVSGLEPSADDADAQIGRFGAVIGGLAAGSFVAADLAIDDDGPTTGTIEAATADTAGALTDTSAGEDVTVSAPAPDLAPLQVTADFDGELIILDGVVFDESEREALVSAAGDAVGAGNVVDNLQVSETGPAVEGTGDRVAAFAAALGTFDGLESGDGMLSDTDLTINGVATDEATQSATQDAVAAASDAGLRPGGEVSFVPEAEISLAEETELLQAELDALQDEIRENVVFDTNSDVLTPRATATLDMVAAAMERFSRPVVEIGGHTDSVGPDDFNLDLSQRRADSVSAYLASVGIADTRLRGVGFGETQPIADNLNEAGRQENRRVAFIAMETFAS